MFFYWPQCSSSHHPLHMHTHMKINNRWIRWSRHRSSRKSRSQLISCYHKMVVEEAMSGPHWAQQCKYFYNLDGSLGYWRYFRMNHLYHVQPFWRYHHPRLPFELKNSQDIFQQKIDECLRGIQVWLLLWVTYWFATRT